MELRFCPHRSREMPADSFFVDFDSVLATYQGTKNYYAPGRYARESFDSDAIYAIINSLLAHESGVMQVQVINGYRLLIKRSMAVPTEKIINRIAEAIKEAGMKAVQIDPEEPDEE